MLDERHCERFREAASLLLDDEDAGVEAAVHRVHAARCPDCLAYAAQLTRVAAVLRDARLERPVRHVAVEGRRRGRGVRTAAAVAALLAIAAGLAGVRGGDGGAHAVAPPQGIAGTAPRAM